MQTITPFLWFDSQAEQAADFYVSVFPDSEILTVARYGEAGPGPAGSAMVVAFKLRGIEFSALNGGPIYQFTPAISFVVDCVTQDEVDHYWDRLGEGGDPAAQQCGWLKDKYGLSWQIVPSILPKLAQDAKNGARVMQALMQMVKLDIKVLQQAYDGK